MGYLASTGLDIYAGKMTYEDIEKHEAKKISEASSISKKALLARISLWDGIENEIKQRKKNYEKA